MHPCAVDAVYVLRKRNAVNTSFFSGFFFFISFSLCCSLSHFVFVFLIGMVTSEEKKNVLFVYTLLPCLPCTYLLKIYSLLLRCDSVLKRSLLFSPIFVKASCRITFVALWHEHNFSSLCEFLLTTKCTRVALPWWFAFCLYTRTRRGRPAWGRGCDSRRAMKEKWNKNISVLIFSAR